MVERSQNNVYLNFDYESYLNKKTLYKQCIEPDLWKTCGKLSIPKEVAENRAEILINRYGAPNCRLFFLKCIYHLSEDTIQGIVENSMRAYVKSPIRYFTSAAKQQLRKKGL